MCCFPDSRSKQCRSTSYPAWFLFPDLWTNKPRTKLLVYGFEKISDPTYSVANSKNSEMLLIFPNLSPYVSSGFSVTSIWLDFMADENVAAKTNANSDCVDKGTFFRVLFGCDSINFLTIYEQMKTWLKIEENNPWKCVQFCHGVLEEPSELSMQTSCCINLLREIKQIARDEKGEKEGSVDW